MKTNSYQTDLQILCESETEEKEFLEYCKLNQLRPEKHFSNVEGQDWHKKFFYEIPFRSDLQLIIQNKFNGVKK